MKGQSLENNIIQARMKSKLIFFRSLFVLSFVFLTQENTNSKTSDTNSTIHIFCYTNPITGDPSISMRDHCIIKVGNQWYFTGTSNPVWSGPNPGVRLLVSDDMIFRQQHSWIIDAGELPAGCPYKGRFWAPEIHYIQNKYRLTVNSGKITKEDPKGLKTHCIWLFSSDQVTGPCKLVNGPLTPQYNNDATLFEDEDGQTYLYCSDNGLFQAKIYLNTGTLLTPVQKSLDKKEQGYPEWMVGGIEQTVNY
jgi:xylan 1,4-beta-xylosidase